MSPKRPTGAVWNLPARAVMRHDTCHVSAAPLSGVIERPYRTADAPVGQLRQVAGRDAGWVAADDCSRQMREASSKMLCRLQRHDAVAGDVDAVEQEDLGVKRLRADRGDEDINVADNQARHWPQILLSTGAHRRCIAKAAIGQALHVGGRL